MSFGAGFGAGYVLGKGKGAYISGKQIALIVIGSTFAVLTPIAAAVIPCTIAINNEMTKLNQVVAETLEYKSVDVEKINCDISDNNEFLFEFSGNAMNINDEKIDFFSCTYKVNAAEYEEINNYLVKRDVESLRSTSTEIIGRITEIVSTAELVESRENDNVATSYKNDDVVILNVSKAKVKDDKVYYYVSHLRQTRDKNGQLGLTTVLSEVSYDLTDELKNNPSGVFSLPGEQAKVKTLSKSFEPVKQLEVKAYRSNSR